MLAVIPCSSMFSLSLSDSSTACYPATARSLSPRFLHHHHRHSPIRRDQTHVEWASAFGKILLELQAFVKQYHTTGLVWNPNVSGSGRAHGGSMECAMTTMMIMMMHACFRVWKPSWVPRRLVVCLPMAVGVCVYVMTLLPSNG